MTPGVERVLRAVAHAHRETGAPISTHTDAPTRRGLEQQAVFREEGVDLSRVVIGHSGDTTDLDYLREVMEAGSFIGMDRFGLDLMLPFEDRVATVAALCAEGYAERMVLSHDASCFTHNFDVEKKRELLPRWVYTHLHDDVLPALRERGVTDAQIEQMLVHNPRRILAR
jgi:phosphotriesterase-related protein